MVLYDLTILCLQSLERVGVDAAEEALGLAEPPLDSEAELRRGAFARVDWASARAMPCPGWRRLYRPDRVLCGVGIRRRQHAAYLVRPAPAGRTAETLELRRVGACMLHPFDRIVELDQRPQMAGLLLEQLGERIDQRYEFIPERVPKGCAQ